MVAARSPLWPTSRSLVTGATIPAVAIIGALVLLGWADDIDTLKSAVSGYVTMMPNTAVSFVLSSIALWLTARSRVAGWEVWVADFVPTIVALIGIITLMEYAAGTDVGIDRILLPHKSAVLSPFPGRMSPLTALNFVLFGAAIMTSRCPCQWLARATPILSFAGLVISGLTLIGYASGKPTLFNPTPYSSSALHTAIAFVLLFVALINVKHGDQDKPAMVKR